MSYARPGSAPQQDAPRARPTGCRACMGSGWREVAWHHGDQSGHVRVEVYAAACDCDLGHDIARSGTVARAHEYADRLRSDPQTLAVYVTDATHPVLSRAERYAPDVLARLEPR